MAHRSYSDLSKYLHDFSFLMEMKALLINEVSRMKAEIDDPSFWDSQIKGKLYTETEDGRQVRIILPHGFTVIYDMLAEGDKTDGQESRAALNDPSDKEFQFVGFFGTRRGPADMQEKVANDTDLFDGLLIKELRDIDGMFAYITGELVKGGDFVNLVLFRDKGVVVDLLKSRNHRKVVSDLSPHYYSSVRIHSGILPDGLTSTFFVLKKTLFLCFTVPQEDPDYRHVQMWRAYRNESDLVKVLPY